MAGARAIDTALDLARMPALAMSAGTPPLPDDVLEVLRIAAASPEACHEAEQRTGMAGPVLVEAARFYLQQILFHPDADAYRVLGLASGAPREVARQHMGWLLQWLHPDHNDGLDAVFANRVLEAWREVSASSEVLCDGKRSPDHRTRCSACEAGDCQGSVGG